MSLGRDSSGGGGGSGSQEIKHGLNIMFMLSAVIINRRKKSKRPLQ